MRLVPPVVLALLLLATPAQAQEFGLDLSQSDGLGLDLAGPELRPTAAFIGATWSGNPAPARFESSVADSLVASGHFASVMSPGEAAAALPDAAAARACADDDCALAIATALGVDLVVLAQSEARGGSPMTFFVYSRDTGGLEQIGLEGAVARGQFAAGAASQLTAALEPLTPARALLKLTVNVEGASAKYGERVLGEGNLEVPLPPVPDILRVSAPGHRAFEQELAPVAGETLEIAASLEVARPEPQTFEPEVPLVSASSSEVPLYERPGFFLVLAGVAAVGLGFGVGASAKSVEARAVDGDSDGALDITRAEAMGAQRSAVIANLLVAGGVAAAGGGVAWLVLAPTVSPGSAGGAAGGAGLTTGFVLAGGF